MPAWLLDAALLRDLKASDLRLLLALGCHNRRPGPWVVWPSRKRLADVTGLDPSSIKRATRRLMEAGVIRMHYGGGRGRLNAYEILLTPASGTLFDPAVTKGAHVRELNGRTARPEKGARRAYIEREREKKIGVGRSAPTSASPAVPRRPAVGQPPGPRGGRPMAESTSETRRRAEQLSRDAQAARADEERLRAWWVGLPADDRLRLKQAAQAKYPYITRDTMLLWVAAEGIAREEQQGGRANHGNLLAAG